MKRYWWKLLGVGILMFVLTLGLLSKVPTLNILNETIRNLFYHVPMWFTMYALFAYSVYHSILFLRKLNMDNDLHARSAAEVGFIFGLMGIATGSLWAKFTWGTFWEPRDPKLNGAAIALLIYLAYFVLRSAVEDETKRARLAAVYNIFAFPMQLAVTYIMPKFMISLHPGSSDTVNFKQYEMDSQLRLVFYPAVLGWILLGFWIFTLVYRTQKLKIISENEED
ncbi:MAG: cytochrome c biogenesis protein CcsA [Bacteroidetes bacterium]|nr:cytochrome c biogenesis protein CcsA [Bacteroidota bacterium]